jgi:hypothetical protein
MLATFMQGVDTTIANVALPHMQGSMSASQDQVAWVVTSPPDSLRVTGSQGASGPTSPDGLDSVTITWRSLG